MKIDCGFNVFLDYDEEQAILLNGEEEVETWKL